MTPDEARALRKYQIVTVRGAPAMVDSPSRDGSSVAIWTQVGAHGAFIHPERVLPDVIEAPTAGRDA